MEGKGCCPGALWKEREGLLSRLEALWKERGGAVVLETLRDIVLGGIDWRHCGRGGGGGGGGGGAVVLGGESRGTVKGGGGGALVRGGGDTLEALLKER